MSKTIIIAGDKGGAGKTCVSHTICHGLGLYGVTAVHVTTDPRRLVLPDDKRVYATLDGRNVPQLASIIDGLADRDDVVLVIDGGGGRPDVDVVLSQAADLTILPFLHSEEDLRVVAADLDRLKTAQALPNRWPTNKHARDAAERSVGAILETYRRRMMSPLVETNGLTTLVSESGPAQRINNTCKNFAVRVLERMGLTLLSFPKRR